MRRSLALLFAAGLALFGTSVLAQSSDGDRVEAFLQAVERIGCVINEANNLALLAELDMTEAEGGTIVLMLMSDGRAVPFGDDLRITTGTCK